MQRPKAVLNQGQYGQTRMCIEGYQNSGTQGPLLSRILTGELPLSSLL